MRLDRRMVTAALCLAGVGLLYQRQVPHPAPESPRLLSPEQAKLLPANVSRDGARKKLKSGYGRLPMFFEPNGGQASKEFDFVARGRGYSMQLSGEGALVSLYRAGKEEATGTALRMNVEGGQRSKGEGVSRLPGSSNYFRGRDQSQWRTSIPHFAKVRYTEVYPGIDLVYYGNQESLEFDFVVAPGADPNRVRLSFDGIEKLEVDGNGDLQLVTSGGVLTHQKPKVYQTINGKEKEVAGTYRVLGKNRVAFTVAGYDARQPLVIDPILKYASYVGGSAVDAASAIALDPQGRAYVTGRTFSSNFRTGLGGGVFTQLKGDADAFVFRVTADGTAVDYATFLGGTGFDSGEGITVESDGEAYIVGETGSGGSASSSFPATDSTSLRGDRDGFCTKLNSTGTGMIYSTFVGSTGSGERIQSIALDQNGSPVMAGKMTGALTSPAPVGGGFSGDGADTYIARYGVSGSNIVNHTFSRATGLDGANDIAVDASGNIYVTGTTGSDAFVARYTTGLSQSYFRLIAGNGTDIANAIAVNNAGEAFVVGETTSTDLPNRDTRYSKNGQGGDAFIARINVSGTLSDVMLFGGSGRDYADDIGIDQNGTLYVAGFTGSSDIPAAFGAPAIQFGGGTDAFLIRVSFLNGKWRYLFSTFFGGSATDEGVTGIALKDRQVIFTGAAGSKAGGSVFPNAQRRFPDFTGQTDAFAAELADIPVSVQTTNFYYRQEGTLHMQSISTFTNNAPGGTNSATACSSGAGSTVPGAADRADAVNVPPGQSATAVSDVTVPSAGTATTAAANCESNDAGPARDPLVDVPPANSACAGGYILSGVPLAAFAKTGGNGSFFVQPNASVCGVSVKKSTLPPWVTLIKPQIAQSGVTEVAFTVQANTTASARTGTIQVEGATADLNVTISQAAGDGTGGGGGGGGTNGSLRYVAVTPCRVMDTRTPNGTFGGPIMSANSTRTVPIPSSSCGIPSSAKAYAINVTVVPSGPLSFLTAWPSGQTRPLASTLNSFEGKIVANSAIIPAGAGGGIDIFVTGITHVIVDINGYFSDSSGLAFYPITPCRLTDTRDSSFPTGFGPPIMSGGTTRTFNLPGRCSIPSRAQAYSLNFTVVPTSTLSFLTAWNTGQSRPTVSTLNSFEGRIVANGAIIAAGTSGAIDVFVTDATQVIIDVNGYFAPDDGAGQFFNAITPCRAVDTRPSEGLSGSFGPPAIAGQSFRTIPLPSSRCGLPSNAQSYSMNVTVVPQGPLGFLTAWPAGLAQPGVSVLNSFDGRIVANSALVPAGTSGGINVFVTNTTEVILDVNGYFRR